MAAKHSEMDTSAPEDSTASMDHSAIQMNKSNQPDFLQAGAGEINMEDLPLNIPQFGSGEGNSDERSGVLGTSALEVETNETDRSSFFESYQFMLSRANEVYYAIINLSVLLDAYRALSLGETPINYYKRKQAEYEKDEEFFKACKERKGSLAAVAKRFCDEIRQDGGSKGFSTRVQHAFTFLQSNEAKEIQIDLHMDLRKERDAIKLFILDDSESWRNLNADDLRKDLLSEYQMNSSIASIKTGYSALLAVVDKNKSTFDTWKMSAQPNARHCFSDFPRFHLNDNLPNQFTVAPSQVLNLSQFFRFVESKGLENSCIFEAFSNALYRSTSRLTELRVRSIVEATSNPKKFCATWNCGATSLKQLKRKVRVDALFAARRFNDVSLNFTQLLSEIAGCKVLGWKQKATATGFKFVQDFTFTALSNCQNLRLPVQLARYNIDNPNGPKNHVVCMLPLKNVRVPQEYWRCWEFTLSSEELERVGACNQMPERHRTQLSTFSNSTCIEQSTQTKDCANVSLSEIECETAAKQVMSKDSTHSTQEPVTSWPDEVCYALGKILEGVKPFSADGDLTVYVGQKEVLNETRKWLLDVDESWHPAVKQAMREVADDIDTVLAKLDQLPTMQSLPTTISLEKLIEKRFRLPSAQP